MSCGLDLAFSHKKARFTHWNYVNQHWFKGNNSLDPRTEVIEELGHNTTEEMLEYKIYFLYQWLSADANYLLLGPRDRTILEEMPYASFKMFAGYPPDNFDRILPSQSARIERANQYFTEHGLPTVEEQQSVSEGES